MDQPIRDSLLAQAYDSGPSVGSDFVNNLYWTYFVADGTVNEVDEVFAPIVDENGLPEVALHLGGVTFLVIRWTRRVFFPRVRA